MSTIHNVYAGERMDGDAGNKHREITRPREVWMRVRYIGPSTETMRYLEVEFDMSGRATRLLVRPSDLMVTERRC